MKILFRTALPATAVAVSIAMRQRGGFAGLVRVVATAPQVPTAVHQLTATARRLGIRLRRLDGDQAPSVYATAPTGGVQ